jgi:O-antigen/teichoic acid export membrane protein
MLVMPPSTRSLADRTASAFAWRLTAKFIAFGLRLAVLVVLARLVSVEAFGLLNQATIIVGLAGLASQLGMGPALIQRWPLTDTHVRVGFTVSGMSGIVLMAALWLGAPLAALTSNVKEIVPILRLLSWTFLFSCLGATAGALLERRLAYRSLFLVELSSYTVGYGMVGIILAYLDYGVWALAWALVVDSLMKAGLLYAFSPHALRPSLARVEARQLVHFGMGQTFARLANYTALTADNFVVGRQLGPVALGLYGRAFQLMALPISEFSEVIGSVLFPAYAQIQNDRFRLRKAFLASVSLTAMVVFPLLTAIAILAPELLVGVFGSQWADAAWPLQILCIGGFFRSIYPLGDSLARAQGAVYRMGWRHGLYAVSVIGAAIVGAWGGIATVAEGVVGALVLIYFLMADLSLRLTGASWRMFFLAQRPGMVYAAAAASIAVPTAVWSRGTSMLPLAVLAGTLLGALIAVISTAFILPVQWYDETALRALRRFKQRGARNLCSLRPAGGRRMLGPSVNSSGVGCANEIPAPQQTPTIPY